MAINPDMQGSQVVPDEESGSKETPERDTERELKILEKRLENELGLDREQIESLKKVEATDFEGLVATDPEFAEKAERVYRGFQQGVEIPLQNRQEQLTEAVDHIRENYPELSGDLDFIYWKYARKARFPKKIDMDALTAACEEQLDESGKRKDFNRRRQQKYVDDFRSMQNKIRNPVTEDD
jgi:hypothetical protein